MSAPVCYVERTGRGSLIRRIRLVGDKLDVAWTPPRAPTLGDAGEPDPTAVVEQTRAAARWVAHELPKSKSLSAVCLDADGAACLWLSAPSADPTVVAAALAAGHDSHSDGEPGGGASLPEMLAAGAGMERSVQALADPREAASKTSGQRRRMAVLSVPDLTVRVFLDELDAQGVTVHAVSTLWHALAASWDPDARAPEHDAASGSACTAVVLIDPEPTDGDDSPTAPGRLIWAWSAGGDLLAGGSMRLRALAPARPAAPETADPTDGAIRRLAPIDDPEERTLACSRADAGRLTTDWLAWSAQLSVCPSRIICVGPVPVPEEPGAGLIELLAQAWQGASVDAAVHPDPIGATLDRFRGRDEDDIAAADPREALPELSSRPGRVHRGMYRWSAAALAALAVVVGVAGWRFNRAAAQVRAQAHKADTDLKARLVELEPLVPSISTFPDPVGLLASTIQRLQNSRPTLEHEKPVLAELARLIEALATEGVNPELKIEELNINGFSGSARLTVPENDVASGNIISAALAQNPGQLAWRADTLSPAAGQTTRTWNLAGTWLDTRRGGGGGR